MDYVFKQVTNGYFSIATSEPGLNLAWKDKVYAYEYILGDNEVVVSLMEYEDSRFLEHFLIFKDQPFDVTLKVIKPSARNQNEDMVQDFYTITFQECRMKRLTNSGHVERISHSTVKLTLSFESYEVDY